MMHTKGVVVDGAWSVVGSANMDIRSKELNSENVLGILDEGFAREMEATFFEDLKKSRGDPPRGVAPAGVVGEGERTRLRALRGAVLSRSSPGSTIGSPVTTDTTIGEQAQREAGDGQDGVRAALRLEGVEPERSEIAAGQPAEVGPVVDAGDEEAEGEAGDDPARGDLADVRAAPAPAVVEDGAEQTEDAGGGADRVHAAAVAGRAGR